MSSQENQQNLEFYPPRLWGLDPLFSARVKLNIEDVLKVPVYPEHYQGVYCLLNHPITNFCIMGDVVMIDRKNKFIVYEVDDGTGSIKCSWHRNHSETHDKQIEDEPQVDMGNLVSMCGRLNVFRDQREIWINSIVKEDDPNSESLHWFEIAHLKNTIYSQPFTLSPQLKRLTNLGGFHLKEELLQLLCSQLKDFQKQPFSLVDLESNKELKSAIISQVCNSGLQVSEVEPALRQVMGSLASDGHIIPVAVNKNSQQLYQVCSEEDYLVPAVLSIFRSLPDQTVSENDILYNVNQNFPELNALPKHRLLTVIQRCVENSAIYPVGEGVYKAVC